MGWFARVQMRRMGALSNVVVTLVLMVFATGTSLLLDAMGFSEATVAIVFVLGVLLTAVLTTAPIYCFAAAVLAILCFNFFLVAPRFSLRIFGADVPGTMAVMFAVALIASFLVTEMRASVKASAEAAMLVENEKLRANLLRSVSHDLRTPLTAISGNADMLLDRDVALSETERRSLEQDIYDDATWLTGVVENLLTVTRLENGSVALEREVELVDDMVEEALRHVSRDVEFHHLTFVPSTELLLARMDAHVMVQVVVNLVNNAIAYTPHGSNIVVSVAHAGDYAEVSVADDGPGISDEDKARVFEPFYTSDRVVADGRRGIGLGLSLCRSIVEAHDGTLRVVDVDPHGALFVFTLPLEEVPNDG